MSPTRSASLAKLSAVFFEEEGSWAEDEPVDSKDLHFTRSLSEGSTAVSNLPFSRQCSSTPSSDDERDADSKQAVTAAQQAARLLKGPITDPGQAPVEGQELIAVRRDGAACYVTPETVGQDFIAVDSDGLGHHLCWDGAGVLIVDASPLVLVASDGTAYYVPDGNHVEWEELLASSRPTASQLQPEPCVRSRMVSCAGASNARAISPLESCDDEASDGQDDDLPSFSSPEGSVPRSPSLKKLSKLLFEADSRRGAARKGTEPEPETLDMDAVGVVRPRAPQQGEDRRRWLLQDMAAQGCSQQ